MNFSDDVPIVGIALVAAVALTFVPTAIAYVRRHPDRRTIASLNALALVSTLLWLALLGWAVLGRREGSVIDRFVANERGKRLAVAGIAGLFVAGAAMTVLAIV